MNWPASARISAEDHTTITRVGIFAPLFPPAYRGGGPIRSIAALVSNLPAAFEALVLTSDRDHGCTEPLPVDANRWLDLGKAEVFYASATSVRKLLHGCMQLRRRRPDVLYFNGFFDPRFTIIPQLLWRLGFWRGACRLIAPRGEFGEGALSRRPIKKNLYIAAYRALGLHRSVIWHATADHESNDIRRIWGTKARVIVRSNDTALPPVATPPPAADPIFRAAFLGRFVEHKGLAVALDALQDVSAPVHFDIYGVEEDLIYVQKCKQLIEKLPPHVSATFCGPLPQEAVRPTLSAYDALLMPTRGENFGHVIAEALSVSCIVVTTPQTPWTELLNNGGGVVVCDRSPERWSAAIRELAAEPPESVHARRETTRVAYNRWAAQPFEAHIFDTLRELEKPDS